MPLDPPHEQGPDPSGSPRLVATGELHEQVRAAIQEIEGREARPRILDWPLSRRAFVLVLVSCLMILGWMAFVPGPPESGEAPPAATEQERALQTELFGLVQAIEAHRERTGSWPEELGAVGADPVRFDYRRGPDGYVLEARAAGVALWYESGVGLRSPGVQPAVQPGVEAAPADSVELR